MENKMEKNTNTMQKLLSFNGKLMRVEEIIMFVAFMAMLALSFSQVVGRYVIEIPTPWAEELALMCFIWVAWVGSAYAQYTGDHLQINIIDTVIEKTSKNPERTQKILNQLVLLFSTILILIILIIYTNFFLKVAQFPQYAISIRVPLTLVQVSIVVFGIFALVHSFIKLVTAKYNDNQGQ